MRYIKLFATLLALFIMVGCGMQSRHVANYWDLSKERQDSIDFAQTHHYTINYNFLVTADSLSLLPALPNESELFAQGSTPSIVRHNDKVVVSATILTTDSANKETFYIKIARDQETMGWIEEELLLKNVVPCDPISQFIHMFSNNYIYGFFIIIALSLLFYIYRLKKKQHIPFVHFQDIESIYPALLCIFTAFAAILYGFMQHYMPDVWEAYYYAPTLNPIGQQGILSMFITCTWIILILFIAALDETHKQLSHTDMIIYLLGLGCTWFIIYVVFSQGIKIYISYPLFIIYLAFAWRQYRRHHIAKYMCGRCGRPIRVLGRCPHCGAINK